MLRLYVDISNLYSNHLATFNLDRTGFAEDFFI